METPKGERKGVIRGGRGALKLKNFYPWQGFLNAVYDRLIIVAGNVRQLPLSPSPPLFFFFLIAIVLQLLDNNNSPINETHEGSKRAVLGPLNP